MRILPPLEDSNSIQHSSSAAGCGAGSVRRTPAWLLSVGGLEFRGVVSSTPYSPAEAGARQNRHRVAGPVRPQPAKATPATSSAAAGYCETDPTGAATARLAREWVMCF